jgi:hypothetical protein
VESDRLTAERGNERLLTSLSVRFHPWMKVRMVLDRKGFVRRVLLLVAVAATVLTACGGDSGTTPPNSDLERMEGSWQGIEFRLTSVNPPLRTFELIEAGGSFRLDIQASGRYAATLTLGGEIGTESGTFALSGNTFTQTPTNPPGPPVTGTWSMPNANSLILDGDIEFDFDFSGSPEPATAHIELVRR